jgi:hypothetical protein
MEAVIDWTAIKQAYEFMLIHKSHKRIDGDFFIIYRVGTLIRIDIKEK